MRSLGLSKSLLHIFLCSCTWNQSPAHPAHPSHLISSQISTTDIMLPSHQGYMFLVSTLGLSGDRRCIIYPTFMLRRAEYEASYYCRWHCSINQSTGSVGRGGSAGPREESKLEESSLTQKDCRHPQLSESTLLLPDHRSWTSFWIS